MINKTITFLILIFLLPIALMWLVDKYFPNKETQKEIDFCIQKYGNPTCDSDWPK